MLKFNAGGKNTGGCDSGNACLCKTANIPSPPKPSVRLASGDNSGLLEVYRYERWGSVCSHEFDSTDAKVACAQLGFAGAAKDDDGWFWSEEFENSVSAPLIVAEVQCQGNEKSLQECSGEFGPSARCSYNRVRLSCGAKAVTKRRCANVCGSRYRSTPFQISSKSSHDCSKTSACQSDCVAFESDVEVDCGGTSSCQGAAFWCGKGHTCEIACSGLSSCGSSLQLFGQWVGHTTRKPSRHPRHDEPAFEHYELCPTTTTTTTTKSTIAAYITTAAASSKATTGEFIVEDAAKSVWSLLHSGVITIVVVITNIF